MEIGLLEALIVIGIGLIGLAGTIQLDRMLGTVSISVTLGPAKYIGLISLMLISCGAISLVGSLRRKKVEPRETGTPIVSVRGIMLMCVLLAYVALVPITGFLAASLLVFPVLFHVSGVRPWMKSVAFGLAMAGSFYIVFILMARLPVPKGIIGL